MKAGKDPMKAQTIEITVIIATAAVLAVGIFRAVNAQELTVQVAKPVQTLSIKPVDPNGHILYAENLQGEEDGDYTAQHAVSLELAQHVLGNKTLQVN